MRKMKILHSLIFALSLITGFSSCANFFNELMGLKQPSKRKDIIIYAGNETSDYIEITEEELNPNGESKVVAKNLFELEKFKSWCEKLEYKQVGGTTDENGFTIPVDRSFDKVGIRKENGSTLLSETDEMDTSVKYYVTWNKPLEYVKIEANYPNSDGSYNNTSYSESSKIWILSQSYPYGTEVTLTEKDFEKSDVFGWANGLVSGNYVYLGLSPVKNSTTSSASFTLNSFYNTLYVVWEKSDNPNSIKSFKIHAYNDDYFVFKTPDKYKGRSDYYMYWEDFLENQEFIDWFKALPSYTENGLTYYREGISSSGSSIMMYPFYSGSINIYKSNTYSINYTTYTAAPNYTGGANVWDDFTPGDSGYFDVWYSYNNAGTIKDWTFSSDNTSVADVDQTGLITAKGFGTANIKFTYECYDGTTKTIQDVVSVRNGLSDFKRVSLPSGVHDIRYVSMSDSGQYMIASVYIYENDLNNSYLYSATLMSEDYGNTWTAYKDHNNYGSYIKMSSSGKSVVAFNGNKVLVSTDYGKTFTQKGDFSSESKYSYSIADRFISDDGKIILVAYLDYSSTTNNFNITISKDGGNSFTKIVSGLTGIPAVSVSSNLQTIMYGYGSEVYVSNDYGTSWTDLSASLSTVYSINLSNISSLRLSKDESQFIISGYENGYKLVSGYTDGTGVTSESFSSVSYITPDLNGFISDQSYRLRSDTSWSPIEKYIYASGSSTQFAASDSLNYALCCEYRSIKNESYSKLYLWKR
ncbi:MAG: Ig-like domain-containing protein [Treponema sp.]|nr:Ig-like domain-containing protein [Treponema sp.]